METSDLTLNHFAHRSAKLVVVKHAKNNYSTFLVEDVEKPRIPGYPACCLTYYRTLKEARLDIKKTYERVNYSPKHPESGFWESKRR